MNQPTGQATVPRTGLNLDLLLGREPHSDRGAAAEFALELDAGAVVRRGMLHDGKAQAGARIELESELGCGTTITVRFPAQKQIEV